MHTVVKPQLSLHSCVISSRVLSVLLEDFEVHSIQIYLNLMFCLNILKYKDSRF